MPNLDLLQKLGCQHQNKYYCLMGYLEKKEMRQKLEMEELKLWLQMEKPEIGVPVELASLEELMERYHLEVGPVRLQRYKVNGSQQ